MTKRKKNNESAKVWKDEWKNKWMNEWISLYKMVSQLSMFYSYSSTNNWNMIFTSRWGIHQNYQNPPPSPALSLPLPSLNYTIKLILKNVGKVILIIFFAYSDGCTKGDGIEGI